MSIDVIKVLLPTAVAFVIGILSTPILTHYLYHFKMWKKTSVRTTTDGKPATISSQLHNDEVRKTPRMGGVVIWGSTLITTLGFALVAASTENSAIEKLNFLSRNQTWIPLFTLITAALFGLIDDYLVCRDRGSYSGGGMSLRIRLLFVLILGLCCGYWFYAKLGMTTLSIPLYGVFDFGIYIIPLFVLFIIGIYSGGIIDGVDGLSGGVFAFMFSAYAVIAFTNGQYDLAAFSSVIVGATLAFLWFNIPPARFFNSETGTMALTTTLVVIAFLTNAVSVLPIIAFLLIMTSFSSLIQILSKRYRNGKKVFLVAPLHNHFQAKGWPPYKVTMRYWILGMILSVVGVIIHLATVAL